MADPIQAVLQPNFIERYQEIVATVIGLGAVYVRYRLSLMNRRIRLASALEVEITACRAAQRDQLANSQAAILKKAQGDKKFIAWYGRDGYPVYEGSASDFVLLPQRCVGAVIKFYGEDGLLRSNVLALASPNFSELSAEERVAHVEDIYHRLNTEYEQVYEKAVTELNIINTKSKQPT
jgi:hypothetical protein